MPSARRFHRRLSYLLSLYSYYMATVAITWCARDRTLTSMYPGLNLPERYWTGLLLIARIILYLVASANVSNDPQIVLSAIVFTVSGIFFLMAFINLRMYKKSILNLLETFIIFLNILLFSVLTWYSLSNTSVNQKAVAYTSVSTIFIIFLLIIFYHVYRQLHTFLLKV